MNTRTLSQGIKPLKIKTFEKQRRLTVQNGLKTAVSFTRSLRSVSHCSRHKQEASGRVTHLFRHFAAYKPDPEVKHGKVKLLDQLPADNFRFRFLKKIFKLQKPCENLAQMIGHTHARTHAHARTHRLTIFGGQISDTKSSHLLLREHVLSHFLLFLPVFLNQ